MTFDLAASLEAASRQRAEGCVKTAEDLDRYRRAIASSEPDGIIEIGTFSGASAAWFAKEAGVPVVTVDVDDTQRNPDVCPWPGVTYVLGRSTDPRTVQAVLEWMRDNKVRRPLVSLDGDHSAGTVAAELCIYAPLVRPGGYCVVEDGLVRWMPWEWAENGGPYHGSPLDAIEAFLEREKDWTVNHFLQGLHPVTQFPSGWLIRR